MEYFSCCGIVDKPDIHTFVGVKCIVNVILCSCQTWYKNVQVPNTSSNSFFFWYYSSYTHHWLNVEDEEEAGLEVADLEVVGLGIAAVDGVDQVPTLGLLGEPRIGEAMVALVDGEPPARVVLDLVLHHTYVSF